MQATPNPTQVAVQVRLPHGLSRRRQSSQRPLLGCRREAVKTPTQESLIRVGLMSVPVTVTASQRRTNRA